MIHYFKIYNWLFLLIILLSSSCQSKKTTKYISAPFSNLDTLSTNDWWNRETSPIIDMKVPRDQVIAFGIYTTSNNTLKLSAQLFPLYPEESREVKLAFNQNNTWRVVQTEQVNEIGWSVLFRIENFDMNNDVRYKIMHGETASFEGLIRKDPINKAQITLAALSCNSNKDRGDRDGYVRNINTLNPDLIFFAGDQSYDHKEHTAAWLKFGLQFRELFRGRPCITIPDDHDIGQGNLWGEGGKKSLRMEGNDGGYFFHPEYV